jgi:DNA-binding transcriptional MerR regulator
MDTSIRYRTRRMLRLHGMPSKEIRAILAAQDPELVHRYMELHRERLEEQLDEQLRTLDRLEPRLTEMVLERGSGFSGGRATP